MSLTIVGCYNVDSHSLKNVLSFLKTQTELRELIINIHNCKDVKPPKLAEYIFLGEFRCLRTLHFVITGWKKNLNIDELSTWVVDNKTLNQLKELLVAQSFNIY